MSAKVHALIDDQTEPSCGIAKIAAAEGFNYIATANLNEVTCGTCIIKLRAAGYAVAAQAQQIECTYDIQKLVGLTIYDARLAFRANGAASGIRFLRVVAEDDDRYEVDFSRPRTDRVNLEARDNVIVKAYIG